MSTANTTGVGAATTTPGPIVSPAFKTHVQEFAMRADALASDILGEDILHPGQTVIIRDSGPWWWWGPSWHRPCYSVDSSCSSRSSNNSDRNKSKDNTVLAVVALVGLGFTLVGLGSAFGRYSAAKNQLYNTHEFQNAVDREDAVRTTDQSVTGEARHLATLANRISANQKSSAGWDITLRTLFGGGLAAFASGVWCPHPVAQTVGLVATAVSGGAMLLKWGFDDSARQNKGDALAMRASIENLRPALRT